MPRNRAPSSPRGSSRSPLARVLRIGVLRRGRIVEERILRPGQTLSLGSHPDNTVVLPPGPGVVERLPLLAARRGRYELSFRSGMHGKVADAAGVQTLRELSEGGPARARGGRWTLPLHEGHRGKVQVGEHAVLFQFVAPPPRPAWPRGGRFHRPTWQATDLLFLAVLVFSGLLHTAALLWIESQPPPRKLTMQDFPERFVRLPLPADPEPTPAPEPEPDDALAADSAAPTVPTSADPEPAAADPNPEPDAAPAVAETEAERIDRIQREVGQAGLLVLIGGAGESSNPLVVADLLVDPNGLREDVAQALAGSSGLRLARQDDEQGLRGGGRGDGVAGQAGVGPARGGEGEAQQKERTQVGRVRSEAPEILAEPGEAAAVSHTLKRYNGRIKACYERELKGDPSLAGKVSVSFVIDVAGDVEAVRIEENSTGNAELAACIKKTVGRVRFVPPPATEVEVAGYPYLLSPG